MDYLSYCWSVFTFKHETAIGVGSESVVFGVLESVTILDNRCKILYAVKLRQMLTLLSNPKTWAALRRLFGLASACTQRNSVSMLTTRSTSCVTWIYTLRTLATQPSFTQRTTVARIEIIMQTICPHSKIYKQK